MAVFDLDKTIIKGSLFGLFIKFSIKSNYINFFEVFKFILGLFVFKLTNNKIGLRYAMYKLISGRSSRIIIQDWAKYVLENIESMERKAIVEKIISLKKNGFVLLLVTNNIELIAKPVSDYYGFDLLESLKISVDENGKCVLPDLNLNNLLLDKRNIVFEYCKSNNVDLSLSFGYGDSKEDYDFLSLLGNPFLVLKNNAIIEFKKGKKMIF